MSELKRTPLYQEHIELDARMVPFAGFEMPIQYPTGVSEEHRAVREVAGLFDISHMGEFTIKGADAAAFVNFVVTNDVSRADVNQAQYTMMCNDEGGIVDDLLVYHFEDRFRLVVNAANIQKDFDWIRACVDRFDGDAVELEDESDRVALMAIQGPRCEEILSAVTDLELSEIGYYRFDEGDVAGARCVVSRTGYTGEDGFEVYADAGSAPAVWRAILEAGRGAGLLAAGLGARDTLRLEVGYALYGNDIDEETTPLEARLGWTVKLDKSDFVGRDALLTQKEEGVARKLCGFVLLERGFPRPGYEIQHDGQAVSTVRSGTVGPTVGQGIGTGYLPTALSDPGTSVQVVIRDRAVPAQVVRMPFYREGSIKR